MFYGLIIGFGMLSFLFYGVVVALLLCRTGFFRGTESFSGQAFIRTPLVASTGCCCWCYDCLLVDVALAIVLGTVHFYILGRAAAT